MVNHLGSLWHRHLACELRSRNPSATLRATPNKT